MAEVTYELNPRRRRRRRNSWHGNRAGHRKAAFIRWYGHHKPPKYLRRLAKHKRGGRGRSWRAFFAKWRRKGMSAKAIGHKWRGSRGHARHHRRRHSRARIHKLPTAASRGFFAVANNRRRRHRRNPYSVYFNRRRRHRRNPSHAMRVGGGGLFKKLTTGFHVGPIKHAGMMGLGVVGNMMLAPKISSFLPPSLKGGWKDPLVSTASAGLLAGIVGMVSPKLSASMFGGAMVQTIISTVEAYKAGSLFGPPPPTPEQIAAAQAQAAAAAKAQAAAGVQGLGAAYSPDWDASGLIGMNEYFDSDDMSSLSGLGYEEIDDGAFG